MNDTEMLDFLMEHDVAILCESTRRTMTADEMYVLGGEFTVYQGGSMYELYRGDSFDNAVEVLEGKDE